MDVYDEPVDLVHSVIGHLGFGFAKLEALVSRLARFLSADLTLACCLRRARYMSTCACRDAPNFASSGLYTVKAVVHCICSSGQKGL